MDGWMDVGRPTFIRNQLPRVFNLVFAVLVACDSNQHGLLDAIESISNPIDSCMQLNWAGGELSEPRLQVHDCLGYPPRTTEEVKGRAAKARTGVRLARAKAERWRNIVLVGWRGGRGRGRSFGDEVEGEFESVDAASARDQ